jgi:hypothetical protein
MNDEVMNTKELAIYLCCSEAALRLWQRNGTGPAYFKMGK